MKSKFYKLAERFINDPGTSPFFFKGLDFLLPKKELEFAESIFRSPDSNYVFKSYEELNECRILVLLLLDLIYKDVK